VLAILALTPCVRAHDLERTQVTLSFTDDGTFTLDIANDPNWLLLRLESFAPSTRIRSLRAGPSTAITSADRDARLRELGPVFIDRVVLWVDGHEIRPRSAEYQPPRSQGPGDDLAPLATFRLRGRMPSDARTLRWLYGLVIDPYPLTIRRADGRSITEWIEGSNWSGTLDLSGQFRQATRFEAMRDYLALRYTHIVPRGINPILVAVGLFLTAYVVRMRSVLR